MGRGRQRDYHVTKRACSWQKRGKYGGCSQSGVLQVRLLAAHDQAHVLVGCVRLQAKLSCCHVATSQGVLFIYLFSYLLLISDVYFNFIYIIIYIQYTWTM